VERKQVLFVMVHQLREKGFNISQIAGELKISRPTVYKYLEMTYEEAENWLAVSYRKAKKLDLYRDWIVAWLEEYPHLSAAQIKDWLLERYPQLSVGDSTVRMYVKDIREVHNIEKKRSGRQYQAIPELPKGKQIQVDWGETKQKTSSGQSVRLYFIAFVMSHSRYKFMHWLDRPFRVSDMIEAHEAAFAYFGGMTDELVYDQDALVAVSENAGDLILTKGFQQYVQERKFKVHLCRKADPESKGKIENVVKFIKHNFADSRIFDGIDNWNERALAWLKRTGNHQVHHTTKKRPDEVHPLEKDHLRPVTQILSTESIYRDSISRNIRKDNTVLFKANRYSVPLGTYGKWADNRVTINIQSDTLSIHHPISGAELARHPLCLEKGKLIQPTHHKRDKSKKIQQLREEILSHVAYDDSAVVFLKEISERYPRYQRDQLLVIKKALATETKVWQQAFTLCLKEKLFSANDFRDVMDYLTHHPSKEIQGTVQDPPRKETYGVMTRDLSIYTHLLERSHMPS